jgi:hypothetical protein
MESFESMRTLYKGINKTGGETNISHEACHETVGTTDSKHRSGVGNKYVPMTIEWVILSRREHLGVQARGLGVLLGYTLTSNDRCYGGDPRGFDRADKFHKIAYLCVVVHLMHLQLFRNLCLVIHLSVRTEAGHSQQSQSKGHNGVPDGT